MVIIYWHLQLPDTVGIAMIHYRLGGRKEGREWMMLGGLNNKGALTEGFVNISLSEGRVGQA